jgi:hypothetical protein
MTSSEEPPFTLALLCERLEALHAGCPDQRVPVADFLSAMEQLSRLFPLLGRGFGFVASDVDDKVATLRAMNGDAAQSPAALGDNSGGKGDGGTAARPFATIRELVEAEQALGTVASGTKARPSGTRTVQRLARALAFLAALAAELAALPADAAALRAPVKAAYAASMAAHHPWAVRQLVGVAALALPGRAEFFGLVGCGPENKDGSNDGGDDAATTAGGDPGQRAMVRLGAAVEPVKLSVAATFAELGVSELP